MEAPCSSLTVGYAFDGGTEGVKRIMGSSLASLCRARTLGLDQANFRTLVLTLLMEGFLSAMVIVQVAFEWQSQGGTAVRKSEACSVSLSVWQKRLSNFGLLQQISDLCELMRSTLWEDEMTACDLRRWIIR